MPKKLGTKKTTETIYLGASRYEKVEQVARRVSFMTEFTLRPSQLIHYMIDEHLDSLEQEIIKNIQKTNKQ